jgi:hypothetical protein
MGLFKKIKGIIGDTFSLSKGGKSIIELTSDPSTGAGLSAPICSIGLYDDGTESQFFEKYGTGNTDWKRVASNPENINQTTHGFSQFDSICHNGTTWVKGQSNSATTLGNFLVLKIVDANNFIAASYGMFIIASHGLTVGETYFESEITAGLITTLAPSGLEDYSNPVLKVRTANIIEILPFRPSSGNGRYVPVKTLVTGTHAIQITEEFLVLKLASNSDITLPSAGLVDGFRCWIKRSLNTTYTAQIKTTDGSTIDYIAGATGISMNNLDETIGFLYNETDTNWETI